ncbi:MAG: branched-chain amino acid transport system substrate-binding protein [Acidobacteriota bacterium]|jgi:branched-chain amino acid transport system substrate-binding protein|nr:branched-chain amino acid transport system substrate-binding protein [Acidobacteriota bacterium]
MKRLAILLPALLLATPLAAANVRQRLVVAPTTITIGGLFTLNGDGSTLGIASRAALDLAARDINLEFDALQLPYHVETVIKDTVHSPETAGYDLVQLDNRGATYVIGPQSSAEAAFLVDYVNAHNIILISQGSTASSLAIAGDNLFRLAPNDKLEGAAIAALMHADGVDTLVPIWRTDAGNVGLRNSTAKSFAALGGTVLAGVSYDASTTDYTSVVNSLNTSVRNARNANPNAHVAVYLAAFDEAVSVLEPARVSTDLGAVRWYGGDGVTQSQALLANATIAHFGATIALTAPNVGLDETTRDRWEPLSAEIKASIGFDPDAYALSVYDAAWVAALSAVESRNMPQLRRASFVRNVQRYWGVTGPTALDDAGDRKISNFDFWTMKETNGTVEWLRTAQYAGGHVSR